jgi:hypothetical protein
MVKHWKDCECRKCDRGRIEKLQKENAALKARVEAMEAADRILRDAIGKWVQSAADS